jgi:hypothetical protein
MRRTHTPTLLQRKMEIFDSDKCTVQGCLLVLFFNSCHIAPILQTTLEKIFSPSDCCYIFVGSLVLSLKINFPLGRTCCLCIFDGDSCMLGTFYECHVFDGVVAIFGIPLIVQIVSV